LVRMMVAVCVLRDLRWHPRKPASFPDRYVPLHQPGCGRVTERVGRNPAGKSGQLNRALEPPFCRSHRFAVKPDEAAGKQFAILPSPQVS
jgi:hypothetical protein